MRQDSKLVLLIGGILTALFVIGLAGMALLLPAPSDATDWWAAAGGAATALATIGLVVATGLLWIVTRESAQAASAGASAAERAAAAAERAAKSAEDAHVSAQETAKRQLRAYLDSCVSVEFAILPDKVPVVSFDVKNVGQTPAYHFIFDSEVVLQSGGHNIPEFKPNMNDRSASFLGAGEKINCVSQQGSALSAEDISDMKSGKKYLFLSVRVEYMDIFVETHVSESCIRYGWDRRTNEMEIFSLRSHNYKADISAL